jgi:hypothetical protein
MLFQDIREEKRKEEKPLAVIVSACRKDRREEKREELHC